ncbi:acyl CoA:acetate/3-ketoacid CoA transferase [Litchfieldella xinjiangensis]|uniref:acyl CoA:acetate/3-ketoacid CoA transferase n=1 Tax=Litchfieldella xinjiangensis TaxID=1166948 RepID=UPI0005BC2EA6|nr:CoA-transferase [Halomonas xinjiangensis]
MKPEILQAKDIASQIPDGSTIAVSGSGGGLVEADEIFAEIEKSFLETGHPRDLTLVHALGLGDRGQRGTNRFAHEGLVRRVIGGHWTWSAGMQDLAANNAIEAYSLPSGVISLLLREIGAGRPGLITRTGLGTFVDPRLEGGKVNKAAIDDLVEVINIDGEDFLRYKPFPIDIGLIRGTEADVYGNISTYQEPADLDVYAVALAAHNSGGRVMAQVREQVPAGRLSARDISIPGVLVNYLYLCPHQNQTYRGGYEMALAGLGKDSPTAPSIDIGRGLRRVVALRAAEELVPAATVNFGFGMSAGVAGVISERGTGNNYWTTIEQGIHGGVMETGDLFGMAADPLAIVSTMDQFDFYHGGGLDIAFLGMAEMDAEGNVNVSHMNGRIIGPGGFIDITQNARKVVFCGGFDAKGVDMEVVDGGLRIHRRGEVRKLVNHVSALTFSGPEARRRGQEVLYITERAVFRLVDDGIELIEYAPGVDIEKDILAAMEFRPVINSPVPMNAECFVQ